MEGSADIIEDRLGRRPVHFSFPYGDETGAGSRLRTRQAGWLQDRGDDAKGHAVSGASRRFLTALPRVPLASDYQSLTYTALYLSGATFAFRNRFQQVSAA